MTKIILLSICCMIPVIVFAQTGQEKSIKERYVDSIKSSNYPYIFPAWAKKITKKGIDMPLPAGVMANYYAGSQTMTISDLQVGFNNNPQVPLDFIKFGDIKANFQSINTRVDLWVLPFVNLYGIFGETYANTEVNIAEPFTFSTTAKFKGPTAGAGMSVGGAVRGIFGIGNYNVTWTSLDKISGTIFTQNMGFRAGHAIPFRSRPDRNFTLWIGATGVYVNRTTEGTIKFSDLTTDASRAELDKIKDMTADWYQTLTPAQKVVTKQIAEKLSDKIDGLDLKDASLTYSLIKRATSNWSMLAGAQFQLNHHWQARVETGFLGGRSSFLGSVNYRFGF